MRAQTTIANAQLGEQYYLLYVFKYIKIVQLYSRY